MTTSMTTNNDAYEMAVKEAIEKGENIEWLEQPFYMSDILQNDMVLDGTLVYRKHMQIGETSLAGWFIEGDYEDED